MASEWQTALLSLTKCHGVPCSLPSRITTEVLKNCKTFSSRTRPRPNVQDQDQDFMIQDQDQDFHFCPRGASRPRPWSRGLRHCRQLNATETHIYPNSCLNSETFASKGMFLMRIFVVFFCNFFAAARLCRCDSDCLHITSTPAVRADRQASINALRTNMGTKGQKMK